MAIKWVDRVATHPGRVQLTPVVGQTNIYDMERADEPTVAGTPINAANLNAMQKNMGLDANMTVYVAVSGSDATGNGSSTAPYQTITKALSVIPKNLNGFSATINIAAGTYDEDVSVAGYFGGYILFVGELDADVIIRTLSVARGAFLRKSNINLTLTNVITNQSLYVSDMAAFISGSGEVNISSNAENGISLVNGAFVYLSDANIFSVTANGILCSGTSTCYVNNLTINMQTGRGIRSTVGSTVMFGTSTITAGINYSTEAGGRIYSGSQTSIPNY